MVSVTISSKNFSDGVKYHPFDKLSVDINTSEKNLNFLVQTIYEEVMKKGATKKEIKKWKKIQKGFVSILGAITTMSPLQAFAQTQTQTIGNPSPFTVNETINLTPSVIMETGLTVALLSVAVGVALSMVMLTTAGVYRMLRKKRESIEWTEDIIKGLVQVLISIPVVYALFYLAQVLFKSLPFLSGLL